MASTHTTRSGDTTRQAWAGGLTVFAAVMLGITGLVGIFRGIMAIAEDEVFVNTPNYVFKFDLTSWGWIHLILGIIAVLVSFGLYRTSTWARVAGVGIAALVIIANFLSLPYYPAWSILMVAMSGFVIWALCAVKREELI
ncbi:hypothetical protein ACFT0G_33260 [Streptomyces sp. NPDC057020]|uniref:DUF7144 family membrane protein n=1 Tax=unclassified Streptomyces TaxID=2593676 RepID=UPI00093944D8|nr:hypothetical protein [Streptomyces sp. CB02009]OKJ65102.1 hypothetical protein AMK27_04555 [Streptomyces sp. CB02009]